MGKPGLKTALRPLSGERQSREGSEVAPGGLSWQALSLSGSALVGCSRETAAAGAWQCWPGASVPHLFLLCIKNCRSRGRQREAGLAGSAGPTA